MMRLLGWQHSSRALRCWFRVEVCLRPFTLSVLSLLVGCSSVSPFVSLEDENPTLAPDDVVTASSEFTLSGVRSSASLASLDLPTGLSLTVQLVTTRSGAKKGNRYTRVKLTNASSVDIPLSPLSTTLETRGPNATLSQSVSTGLTALPAGKTAYRSTKSIPVSNLTYAQLCGVASFEGVTPPVPLEVCEAGSLTPAGAARAVLEPLARSLLANPTPDQTAWTWVELAEEDGSRALQTLSFDTWLKQQTQSPALTAFALEMKRQFTDLTVYLDELPCHNCHQFTTTLIGHALWGLGGFSSSMFWDS